MAADGDPTGIGEQPKTSDPAIEDSDDGTRPPAYLETASLCSILTFGWMNPVINEGNRRMLTEKDMPELTKRDKAVSLKGVLQSSWDAEKELHSKNPQLWRAAFKAYFPIQLPLYVPFAIVTAAKIVQAHVGITGLIDVLIYGRGFKEGVVYASVIALMGFIVLMLYHQVQFMAWRLGLDMRTSIESAIFRKILRMPLSAFSSEGAVECRAPGEEDADAYKKTMTVATILNLVTTDVERFQPVSTTSHYLFMAPFEIAAIAWCGVQQTGFPFLIGIAALLMLIPVQV
ncbi:atp-binding sub-family c (cftr mrp) member 4 [Nannochloropsis gaditana]|uniref:Atp-binding sub-family c (Cftr mrp) member 4 n=1 Tax=Nannochloropsis gaditana TaxID=72520 RepID=W7TXZ8_9STRA|nr:atp-binding sub-family c (cftr mrp) member 4 [Nannochloropsis gaditana]